jgi:putative flippase GtrA
MSLKTSHSVLPVSTISIIIAVLFLFATDDFVHFNVKTPAVTNLFFITQVETLSVVPALHIEYLLLLQEPPNPP